ncbi:N-6 DNA methylase [uncultured Thiodictyon sp.]|uniref:type I restriction-modification system subunit M n=1 Tax=uncultured Thiodictyon sp. TaxID=1846217 RepID=UPI0025DE4129|nr:N-6 DNA methylase [uncultured Thiodictyon sp.]
MTSGTFKDIEQLEADLWEAADNLRANCKLTSSDYFMPVLGVIFLRHAANRFDAAARQIAADQASGQMPQRKLLPEDYIRRRALYLPEPARFDWIMQQAALGGTALPRLVNNAMTAIEASFAPLVGVLPKDDGIFETKVLEDLMRVFNSDRIRSATGDVFGRIYEYFLAKFSVQKAHDNGEFFTPSALVQTIVNVIEPDHGIVFDPACGSGGMFVQSSHFIEHAGGDTRKKVLFYGQEKNPTTIRLATMNLAVHGLEGQIAEAITYYQDEFTVFGQCDFVMANPPFNVDLVDAERIAGDPRLPFGLPGVNKQKKVGNGNYLWISYFWSYLNVRGRAGFVMSSQASSAGHGEKEVRRKLIETGDLDLMISIRANFFYTRTVPCELWFLDRGKPAARRDQVLMLDARNIYRKVTRKIYDFSPEQMHNLAAIVWLYRGQRKRFLGLVSDYLTRIGAECTLIPPALAAFESLLTQLSGRFQELDRAASGQAGLDPERRQALTAALAELAEATGFYTADAAKLLASLSTYQAQAAPTDTTPPVPGVSEASDPECSAGLTRLVEHQHAARHAFEPIAESTRGLIKQVDLLYKLSARGADLGAALAAASEAAARDTQASPEGARHTSPGQRPGSSEKDDQALKGRDTQAPVTNGGPYDRRAANRELKQLEEARKTSVEQLRRALYFHRQVVWLQDRFPRAELVPVPGLVRVVDRAEIAAADWSLTPGRYVGVAPPEIDDDFDFEQTLRDIHTEIADLNREAAGLAERIAENFEGLGI